MNSRCSLIALVPWLASPSQAQQRNWYPYVIARGSDRDIIRNTPVHERPFRPMHFYGNTQRRIYYRNTSPAVPRNFARSSNRVFRRR